MRYSATRTFSIFYSLLLSMLTGCGQDFYGMGDCYEEDFIDQAGEHEDIDALKDHMWHIKGEMREGFCNAPVPDLLKVDNDGG